jgi:hypothetical protein
MTTGFGAIVLIMVLICLGYLLEGGNRGPFGRYDIFGRRKK